MMRLNFATLSEPMQKTVGQQGTEGTASNHAAFRCPTMPGNTGDAVGQTPATVIEKQAERLKTSHLSHPEQNKVGRCKSSIHAVVPLVPPVPPKKHMNEIDREAFEERRTCAQCQYLQGRACSIAKPGGLVSANRGYRPNPEILQRCAGYMPNDTDTDQRSGGERWPGLVETKGSK